jgi:hypothetical protein
VTDGELGRRNVSFYNIWRLARALDVTMADLVGEAERRHASADTSSSAGP